MVLSKQYHKKTYRYFWTVAWQFKSLDEWIMCIADQRYDKHTTTLQCAVNKLVLERKLTEDTAASIKQMLASPDKESIYIGLMIMQKLKPKKFKKDVQERIN